MCGELRPVYNFGPSAAEPRMSIRLTILCALLTLIALTGCGNKGPLYLPAPEPAAGGLSPADGNP